MDYEKQLKSVGNIGADVSFDPPSITTAFQQGISQVPKTSYKQWLAFKPKFVQFTINTATPATYNFWAPADFNVNPN